MNSLGAFGGGIGYWMTQNGTTYCSNVHFRFDRYFGYENVTELVSYVNQTLHAEYENRITNLIISAQNKIDLVITNSGGYYDPKTGNVIMSFDYEDVLNRDRDDVISIINTKNREMLVEKSWGNNELYTTRPYFSDISESITCACDNGFSDYNCNHYTVDPECKSSMCWVQRWYFHTSLLAGNNFI